LPITALFVTVAVNPLVVTSPVRFGFVTVPELPVTDPVIAAVTVNPVSVPTDVMFGCAAVVTVPAVVELVAVVALVAVAAFPVVF
jgi:hypothetical protein